MITTQPTPDAPQPESAAKMPRRLKYLLIASLTLNLLVIGVVGGAVLGHGRRPPPQMVGEVGFGPFTDAFTRDQRSKLRSAYLSAQPDQGNLRERMAGEFASLLTVLRAEPYDPAALATLVGQQQTRNADRVAIGHRLFLDQIAAMDSAERLAFADRLEQNLHRRKSDRPPRHD